MKSIKLPNETASNVEEIGRHLQDLADGELDAPRSAAIQMFVDDYTNQYSELFKEKAEGQYLYAGDSDD